MKSRYDFYTDSAVLDEETGDYYPDPLTIDFNQGKIERIPIGIKISSTEIAKPWILMEKYFKSEEYDDILLLENNVPYVNTLKPGDQFYIPQGNDLVNLMESSVIDS